MTDSQIDAALAAARAAGAAMMPLYEKNLISGYKEDGSPVTLADQASHAAIAARLDETGVPVVSEEGNALHMDARRYWLVDPLDGTKDFLAASGQFTVNVALIEDHQPVLGVLYAPACDELYVGVAGQGAWSERNGVRTSCSTQPKSDELRMASSRFHDHPDAEAFARANRVVHRIPVGAALKYGRLAMGQLDVYPRLVGTSEWDTAAGQALLEAAGGGLLDWHSAKPLRYGKARRRNGRFLAFRAPYTVCDFHRETYEPGLL